MNASPQRDARSLLRLSVPLCIGWLTVASLARADERIVIQGPGGVGQIAVTGTVIDYSGRGLEVRVQPAGTVRRFAVADVISVATHSLEPHERGRQHLAKQQWSEAIAALEEALEDEDRVWVRREILSLQLQAFLHLGDELAAIERFLAIAESDSETIYFAMAPLHWDDDAVDARLLTRGRELIERGRATGQLIGASLLLASPTDRDTAAKTLRTLSRDGNLMVQRLAQQQYWRVRLTEGDISDEELRRWGTSVEACPPDVRSGGCYLLGRAYRQRGEWDRAASWFLYVPFVYDESALLAARALDGAADCLAELGDANAAARLRAERHLLFP